MTWIKTVKPDEATGRLAEIYELTKSPHGTYDNVYISKSLRPETIMGHDTLYKAVLHHADVTLPLWLLELIATYTSILNNCEYAATHHGHNYRTLLGDPARAAAIDAAMASGALEEALTGRELAFMRYTRLLTLTPGDVSAADIEAMRAAGASDGEILEVNQCVALFNYSNRSLSGLGVQVGDDRVGYY
ncbi:MAG: peroxidase-related enzyme [Anaerolineales bacterium]|nr:peroxidase-related enzyme [Anaerolineales bacterium]